MHKPTSFALTLAAAIAALAATPAFADHNSPMGAGWANMPNDIHNTRIDTRLTLDDAAFLDFVRYGAGADSVNRYLTDSTSTSSTATLNPTVPSAMSSLSGGAMVNRPIAGGRR
jgi:hypothetical protein